MKTYQFLVKCVFIELHEQPFAFKYGFFATFFVKSNKPMVALEILDRMVRERMKTAGISMVEVGQFQTQCVVDEFWELVDDHAEDEKTDGLSLFRLGRLSSLLAVMEFWWIRVYKPHMLVFPRKGRKADTT